ncbi:glycosyltransferase family 2 protein [Candidatus Falkowbacteria bacterium]|jgi:polyprenyl-phospho-N-acetylgalactosaminyl synthase|nr:glycosyltransferase family 2 protein [Candidatus Falkowbacteria bacterium]MBT5502754.1 glycosyltransferase family 2 protein [Candidatus Falkowbacteria bacterium]MBT6573463.1 glycosyltransferase family 2 protein [Candidatus Falkowbacteria bacterium]MBT7348280.1 glycosyltransferase family 2 protein [Candidatus Falkowbacteria bacterium]MBT7501152.1 glycosyltransferase family 2 protein [Candidatus Falkowbacteria bacterium]
MKSCIVIPAFNEGGRIKVVLTKLLQSGFKNVILVDDGSDDETLGTVKELPIIVAQHQINLGQGAALRTGTQIAMRLGFDVVVHFDADGQHRIEDIDTMLKVLENEDVDVVIGSRFLQHKSNLPLKKRIILWLAKIFSRKLLQLEFTDPQSGLRAFRTSIISKIDWQHDDFAHCSEILSLIAKNRLRFEEVPIKVEYSVATGNKSVKPQMRMGWRLLIAKLFNKL